MWMISQASFFYESHGKEHSRVSIKIFERKSEFKVGMVGIIKALETMQ